MGQAVFWKYLTLLGVSGQEPENVKVLLSWFPNCSTKCFVLLPGTLAVCPRRVVPVVSSDSDPHTSVESSLPQGSVWARCIRMLPKHRPRPGEMSNQSSGTHSGSGGGAACVYCSAIALTGHDPGTSLVSSFSVEAEPLILKGLLCPPSVPSSCLPSVVFPFLC